MKNRLDKEYEKWILKEDHPCIMAQTVFSQDQVVTKDFGKLGTRDTAVEILKDLKNYITQYDFGTNDFQSFIAIFSKSEIRTEEEFELLLWKQLELINSLDNQHWDPTVSPEPKDQNFSFSIAGRAFYIVGMHPNSSRLARRSPQPAIAFNLHIQFEKLREMGAFEKVRDKIRDRDKYLQGSVNPMLQDFGTRSEARQYSGRAVGKDWVCPFHTKEELNQ